LQLEENAGAAMETQPADSYSVIYGVDTDGTLQIVPPAELLELIRTHKARAPVLAKFEADETVKAALEQFLIEISSRSENEEWHLRKDEEGRVLVSWDQDVIPVLEAAKLKDLEDCASSRDINHLVLLLVEAYGADGSKHRPSQTKLFDFLKQHVFYASHRLSILPDGQEQAAANIDCVADDKSIMLRVDKNTLWKISGDLSKDRITLQSSFDTTGFSRDCGRQALVDRCPATLLCPEAMGKDRARKLNGKRQPVFMGVGPKRERELLLLSPDTLPYIIHTQVKPDEWDKVVRANPEFSMPSYEEIQEMSDVTLFFSDVKIMSSSNIVSCGVGEGKVPFGKQTMDPIPVGVAFSSGVRLERQIFTDYHRVFENSKIDKGAEGAFKPEAYAELMRKRFEPVFRHRPAGKYWLTPVGLGVYSEAVPAADKEALMRSWIREPLKKSLFSLM